MRSKQTPHHNNSKLIDYLKYFLKTNITAKTIINAATPCSPRALSKFIKFFVTCEPKKATSGPNIISAITETPNKRTPNSRNLFKYDDIFVIQLFLILILSKNP